MRTYDEAEHDHLTALNGSCDCTPTFGCDSGCHPCNCVGQGLEDDNTPKPSVKQVEGVER